MNYERLESMAHTLVAVKGEDYARKILAIVKAIVTLDAFDETLDMVTGLSGGKVEQMSKMMKDGNKELLICLFDAMFFGKDSKEIAEVVSDIKAVKNAARDDIFSFISGADR